MFASMDIYGYPSSFTTLGKRFFQTTFGGFLTFLTVLIVIGSFIYFGQDLIFKQNPRIVSQNLINLNYSKIQLNSSIVIPWRIEDGNSEPINIEGMLYPYFVYHNLKRLDNGSFQTTSTYLNISKCTNNNLLTKNIPNIETFFCLDGKEINSTFGGYFNGDFVDYFFLGISLCPGGDNYSENCTEIKKIKNSLNSDNPYIISFYYPQFFFDQKSIQNPSKIVYQNYFYYLTMGLLKTDRFFFKKTILYDDLGWLTENIYYYEKISIKGINPDYNINPLDDVSTNPKGLPSDIYHAVFYFDKDFTKYTRSFMKIQDLFAIIGGIVSIWSNICQSISYFINVHDRDILLVNKMFNFDRKKNDTIKFHRKFHRFSVTSKAPPIKKSTRAIMSRKFKSARDLSWNNVNANEFSLIHNNTPNDFKISEDNFEMFYKIYRQKQKSAKYKFSFLFALKMFFCENKVFSKEGEKANLYKVSIGYLSERMDILFYLRNLQTIDKLKTVFLNSEQILALDFFKKFNLMEPYDLNCVTSFVYDNPKSNLKEVINYFKSKPIDDEFDVNIINSLDRDIRDYILKEEKKRKKSL